MKDTNTLLNEAILEMTHLQLKETFLVKDLFKGYEWNRLPHNLKLRVGILFLNAISSYPHGVTVLEKTSSNQQKYEKN